MTPRFVLPVLVVAWLCGSPAAGASSRLPELDKNDLVDVARVSWIDEGSPAGRPGGYRGPVLYVNRELARKLGASLTDFFEAHEECHVTLGHVQARFFSSDPVNRSWNTETFDRQADACAVRTLLSQGKLKAARDAFCWFRGKGPCDLLPLEPPARARAENIHRVAQHAGVCLH